MDNKIVRYKQLKETIEKLWTKIKQEFVSDVQFDTTPDTGNNNKPKNKLTFKKNGNAIR